MKECYVFSNDKTLCSGCGSCAISCRHNALKMIEDEEGFLYPVLDKNKCINCGLCNKICPELYPKENKSSERCILATTTHREYSNNSATIGVCTMLAKHIIDQKGVVCGAWLDEETWTVKHILIADTNSIEKIRNSKYAQSELGDVFQRIKEHLLTGDKVLFTGTPCQVAGLKSFLRKDYENLYTIDLICHGVYSKLLLRKEIDFWQAKFSSKISNFKFRSKKYYYWADGGVINFDYKNKFGQTKHYECHGSASPIYRCYAYSPNGINYNLRPSCYSCHFRGENRYGDITVGDSWMVKMNSWRERMFIDEKNGTSLISINTEKGKEMIRDIEPLLKIRNIEKRSAFCQPALLKTNRSIPQERFEIYDSIHNERNIGNIVEGLFGIDLEKTLHSYNIYVKKQHFIRKIKYIIKKILTW